jgi:long-chain fatty acid transport protein
MMKRILFLFVLSVLCIITLSADEDHFINIFVGDRAAGMAGAYTAIADGPEGAYYNPAGLAFSSSRYFSLSTNAIQYKTLRYEDIHPDADPPVDYLRTSFSFVPNFFGFIQKGKKTTFAFTMTSLDNEVYDQKDRILLENLTDPALGTFDQSVNVNFNHSNAVNEVGPSLAFLTGDTFGLGFSLFIRYRNSDYINQQVTQLYDSADDSQHEYFQVYSTYYSEELVSLRPQAGLQWMPTENLSVGYLVTAPIPVFMIQNSQSTVFIYDNTGLIPAYTFDEYINVQDNTVTYWNIFSNPFFRSTYLKNSLGLAWFASRSLILSGDVYLYVPIPNASGTASRVFTWNAALGMEWYISPNFPFRLGIFTNNSNKPSVSGTNSDDHVDLYGGSLSIGYATADSAINLGFSASYGAGQAQISAGSTAVQDLKAFSMSIFLSGGYQF